MALLVKSGGLMRRMAGAFSRGTQRTNNKLGRIKVPMPEGAKFLYRDPKLHVFDTYYDGRQYDHLTNWDDATDVDGAHIPVRKRAPRLIFGFPKVMASRMASKLVGNSVFPRLGVEGDPETEEYYKFIIKASKIRQYIIDLTRHTLATGSGFLRFAFVEGAIRVIRYDAKFVYPEFKSNGELASAMIRFTFQDKNDLDSRRNPKVKWFRLDLTENEDIAYDTPDFDPEKEPQFKVAEVAPHNLGFVQGEWFRTVEQKDTPDGISLAADILDFVDELNYSLSQSSQAVAYNQDPQLVIQKMDQEEMGNLIRSSLKAWNLGRDGEAKFLESSMNGVTTAMEFRDKIRLNLQDLARVILMDPEKVAAHAQSGRAMEILHAPMIELVDELRPVIGGSLKALVVKIGITNLILAKRGEAVPVTAPKGFVPSSFDPELNWPPVFAQTLDDLQKKVGVVAAATGANVISRATGTKYLQDDFNIEDLEEEIIRIDEQKVINPFGAF